MYVHVCMAHMYFACDVLSDSSLILYIVCIEVTQEVAARGLGLTYDLCDGSTKEVMVQSLVSTLMEGRR